MVLVTSMSKEVIAEKIMPVIARLRPKPQLTGDELFDLPESTTAR